MRKRLFFFCFVFILFSFIYFSYLFMFMCFLFLFHSNSGVLANESVIYCKFLSLRFLTFFFMTTVIGSFAFDNRLLLLSTTDLVRKSKKCCSTRSGGSTSGSTGVLSSELGSIAREGKSDSDSMAYDFFNLDSNGFVLIIFCSLFAYKYKTKLTMK